MISNPLPTTMRRIIIVTSKIKELINSIDVLPLNILLKEGRMMNLKQQTGYLLEVLTHSMKDQLRLKRLFLTL